MSIIPTEILIFSNDTSFYDEVYRSLYNYWNASISHTYDTNELLKFINNSAICKLVIFDTSLVSNDIQQILAMLVSNINNAFCIYVSKFDNDESAAIKNSHAARVVNSTMDDNFTDSIKLAANKFNIDLSDNSIDSTINRILFDLGIPPHINGYMYLHSAIEIVVQNPNMINLITKNLYVTLSKEFNSSSACIERSIRHAIERTWCNGNVHAINRYFSPSVTLKHKRPTNSEFIAIIAGFIRNLYNI
ncbi:MAG: hypothetical protein HFE63_00050 [Clostridiales bacterium]|nr:hypothetical protein [Clostridiales bacterium]